MSDIIPYADRVSLVARALVDASAAAIENADAQSEGPAEAQQLRVTAAALCIPPVLMAHRDDLGVQDAPEEKLTFAMMAVALGFVGQPLPPLLDRHKPMARFGRDIRAAFDELLGYKRDAEPPEDDGTVWALFFDDDGCGPSAVSLTAETLDHRLRPGEVEPSPDDPLARSIMIGVALSPSEIMRFVEPGGFALKVPAAERLIAKVREAIDRQRDPRLDAPRGEVG